MNKSFHLTNFRQLNIFIIYDGSCAFLIVCRICFAYLNLGNPLFFLRDLRKALRKAACRFIYTFARAKLSASLRYGYSSLYWAGVTAGNLLVLLQPSILSESMRLQTFRQQPKIFANIIDCSAVGYALYLIALFAIFLTLRLNVLLDNVYGSFGCGLQTEAL